MARKRHPRGTGSVSFRKGENRYRGTLYVDGLPHYIYAPTEDAAWSELDKLRERLHRQQPVLTADDTVEKYVKRWLEETAAPTVRPSTLSAYRQHIDAYIVPSLGRIRIDRLTPADVQRMVAALQVAGRSPATIQRVRATLRRALNIAMRWDLITRNPATLVTLPPIRRARMRALTPDQVGAFVAACEPHPLGRVYLLALATGMRLGEVLGLAWKDVDLNGGWLEVAQQLQRIAGGYQLVPPKSAESQRRLALGEVAVATLRVQQAQQTIARTEAQQYQLWEEWGLAFTTATGRPLNPSWVSKQLALVLTAANLPTMRFHDLRHSAASLVLEAGGSLVDVKEMLGHSQVSLTANLYLHAYDSSRRATANRLDSALRKPPAKGTLRDVTAS